MDGSQVSQFNNSLGLIIGLVFYIAFAFPLYSMSKKTGSGTAWFAFVPILNLVLLAEIAGKDWWWALLVLIPCIGFFIAIILWMGAAEAMEKPSWVGLLMLVPFVNILVPFYIAYG